MPCNVKFGTVNATALEVTRGGRKVERSDTSTRVQYIGHARSIIALALHSESETNTAGTQGSAGLDAATAPHSRSYLESG